MELITRLYDAKHLNHICNLPEVRAEVANGTHELDCTPQVNDTRNVLLMGEHGGCMFLWVMPGIYEVHTVVAPSGWGAWTHRMTAECARWMFTRTPAFEIATRVPEGHLAAKWAAMGRGMRRRFTRHNEEQWHGKLTNIVVYSFTIQDWVETDEHVVELGRQFHDMLHDVARSAGIKAPPHEDDENHNRYVGAAMLMVQYGQVHKGVRFYNRWATLARHDRIELKTPDDALPCRIEIDSNLFVNCSADHYVEVVYGSAS
jgi:hypothetical protein